MKRKCPTTEVVPACDGADRAVETCANPYAHLRSVPEAAILWTMVECSPERLPRRTPKDRRTMIACAMIFQASWTAAIVPSDEGAHPRSTAAQDGCDLLCTAGTVGTSKEPDCVPAHLFNRMLARQVSLLQRRNWEVWTDGETRMRHIPGDGLPVMNRHELS